MKHPNIFIELFTAKGFWIAFLIGSTIVWADKWIPLAIHLFHK